MDKLKLALVGAGRRGAGAYLPVIPKMDDVFDFVAICDINPDTHHPASCRSDDGDGAA